MNKEYGVLRQIGTKEVWLYSWKYDKPQTIFTKEDRHAIYLGDRQAILNMIRMLFDEISDNDRETIVDELAGRHEDGYRESEWEG